MRDFNFLDLDTAHNKCRESIEIKTSATNSIVYVNNEKLAWLKLKNSLWIYNCASCERTEHEADKKLNDILRFTVHHPHKVIDNDLRLFQKRLSVSQ